ncbi:putative enzyme related to lactoylglutathione lyase [Friedmanniella endophytica]|uniref:Putative enzyme related to lactoylglutathione lyase n=1 Tax=Microlunatus kandeliicorticis TaxID=1759536 RepID=A0A7W3P5G0_9ACTN|nr:VOC family protein [Microlunatus kandeliicorticis]MBA8793949.1 putative enzyme related to lactoylglutathione lyase [Microlunatus kandeliicorticis]
MQTYDHGSVVLVLDCADLERAAAFWCAALGYRTPVPAVDPYLQLVPGAHGGLDVLLQRTTDVKHEKNWMHLDLRTPDLETETARLVDLGATLLTAEPVIEDGWRWHVLADPDGNELCVLEPPTTDVG